MIVNTEYARMLKWGNYSENVKIIAAKLISIERGIPIFLELFSIIKAKLSVRLTVNLTWDWLSVQRHKFNNVSSQIKRSDLSGF